VTDIAAMQRDRRRFHAHAATGLLGMIGWPAVAALERLFVPAVIPWLLIGFSLLLTASGVLAIMVQRTFITGPVELEDDNDPHDGVGDALTTPGIHTLDFAPSVTRAVGPYAFLAVGLGFLALSGYWAYAGLP
jgi:hypothetical protein